MPRPPLLFGVVYDFRDPPDSGVATPSLYAEILDQVAWLDGLGLDLVWVLLLGHLPAAIQPPAAPG